MFDYHRRTNEHLHHGAGLKARDYSTLTTLLQLNGLQEWLDVNPSQELLDHKRHMIIHMHVYIYIYIEYSIYILYIYILYIYIYHASDWGMLGIWHIWQTGSSTTNASTIIVKHWYTSGMHRLTPQLFRTGLLVDMQYLLSMFTYTWIPNTQTTLATSWPKKYDFIPLSSPWFKNKNAILTTCQKTHTYIYIYYMYTIYIYYMYTIYIYTILYIYYTIYIYILYYIYIYIYRCSCHDLHRPQQIPEKSKSLKNPLSERIQELLVVGGL